MGTHERWIELVDREGIITFIAEGAYVRYGWPVHVTIERSDGRYKVSWVNDDDGVSVAASGEKDLDRAGLEHYLDGLLADGRPVVRTGV